MREDQDVPDGYGPELPAAARAWLADVVDGLYGGYFVWEPDTGYLWCSDALLATVGRTREDFEPRYEPFRELLPSDDRERVEGELLAAVTAGRDYDIEFSLRRRDGVDRMVDSRAALRVDEAGRRWYVGMIRDVTEARATRRALEESEARSRDMAENIPGALLRYVSRADGRDEVEWLSPGCVDIWEVPAEAIRQDASALWSVVVPEDAEAMRASVASSAASLSPWDHVWRIRTPSGRLKWLHGRGTPRRQPDGGTMWNSIILDVSELRATEAELRDSQLRLAHASKLEAIGKLTGGVAHDFNNLLAVIVGNAELLEGETDPAALRDGLRRIHDAAERGSSLTRSLLSFARQAPLAPTSQDLCAVVRDALDIYRRTVPESIRIETALPDAPCHVVVDRNTLENALLNLVINARDAMPGSGTLTISVRTVESAAECCADCRTEGPHHEIAVRDSGTGMTPELLERVFDPFFSTKRLSEGSGLGLSMVHGFASQSGGCVCIESEPGVGTRVAINFPARHVDAAPAEARPMRSSRRLPPLRTLLVEDDPAVRTMLAKILERAGLQVATVASGDEALAALDGEATPDLLITDMVLPGRAQGPDVVRHARGQHPTLPILVLTGYTDDASVLEGDEAVDAVLFKPTPRDLLIDTLDRVVRARGFGR